MTPGDLDAALAEVTQAKKHHPKCHTCRLPDDVRAWVERKFLDEHVSLVQIHAAVEKMGHKIGYFAMNAHFRAHHERVEA